MDDELSGITLALTSNHELETKYGDGDEGNFLSGWQCENPYADEFIKRVREKDSETNAIKYNYMEMDEELSCSISEFHRKIDGDCESFSFPSPCGSTSIIFSYCAHMARNGVKEIYYLPPIYFSMHFALKLFGIRARPISGVHAYEKQFSLNLPKKKTVLAFVDPIWFTGQKVPASFIQDIAQWQQETGSSIFVDGSFQYMPWEGERHEESSRFDPSLTMRMVCPTKIMAIHGYRFSYALMPKSDRVEFTNTFTNIYASSTASNLAFAREAVHEMEAGTITQSIIQLAKNRFSLLTEKEGLQTELTPNSGYFTFAKVTAPLPPGYKLMTQEFFEQRRFPEYAKVNLISPSFYLIDPNRT